jgi:galactokinase
VGDHAAIYLGQRGKIAHVGYLPFRVERTIDAPAGYQVIIADSHIKAAKSKAAKDLFNARIASYNLGFAVLRRRCPEYAGVLEHVRDIDPRKLGCEPCDIYRMLLKVPQYMTREDFQTELSGDRADLVDANFASHDPLDRYPVRGVLLFGAAETVRSETCIDYLARGELARFGTLMIRSHDGDRVARLGPGGAYRTIGDTTTDEHLQKLCAWATSEDPDRAEEAQLYLQPGSYGCSTPDIDRMVDLACSVEGVVGAQIAGAGLGGCVMILAKNEAAPALRQVLTRHYYRPKRLPPAVLPCIPVEGAGLVEF